MSKLKNIEIRIDPCRDILLILQTRFSDIEVALGLRVCLGMLGIRKSLGSYSTSLRIWKTQ